MHYFDFIFIYLNFYSFKYELNQIKWKTNGLVHMALLDPSWSPKMHARYTQYVQVHAANENGKRYFIFGKNHSNMANFQIWQTFNMLDFCLMALKALFSCHTCSSPPSIYCTKTQAKGPCIDSYKKALQNSQKLLKVARIPRYIPRRYQSKQVGKSHFLDFQESTQASFQANPHPKQLYQVAPVG